MIGWGGQGTEAFGRSALPSGHRLTEMLIAPDIARSSILTLLDADWVVFLVLPIDRGYTLRIVRGDHREMIEYGVDRHAIAYGLRLALIEPLRCEAPATSPMSDYIVPPALAAMATAVGASSLSGYTGRIYRDAKVSEMLCETLELWQAGDLTPICALADLSIEDARRVAKARRMLASRFGEKLTLDSIALSCGFNRAKLTRGFRAMFGRSVSDVLSEERLAYAIRELQTTGKRVKQVAFEAGYSNNAAFTRAFSGHFGMTPRAARAAA